MLEQMPTTKNMFHHGTTGAFIVKCDSDVSDQQKCFHLEQESDSIVFTSPCLYKLLCPVALMLSAEVGVGGNMYYYCGYYAFYYFSM